MWGRLRVRQPESSEAVPTRVLPSGKKIETEVDGWRAKGVETATYGNCPGHRRRKKSL